MPDAVRAFVARHLGDGGVLIFDETGEVKQGAATAGTGRQYTGTAGRIENAIVAVYAGYATAQPASRSVSSRWLSGPRS